ncbi:AI-2E family transporter [Serinibacter arcticus]|uniref:AI-2E family transporter n=1 Tax=Serinibacter arcticus TaxID=1655435 RepID=A0A2U1ZTH6_9MICO|nr:AI-2E family transporter [Serinibacter arcticus]PWD50287.1 AI-2E family transporter [Serinibacter arcticus]
MRRKKSTNDAAAAPAATTDRAAPASTGLAPPAPPHHSDAGANRPPRWLLRALVLTVVVVFVAIFTWNALGSLKGLFVNLLIAMFIALALEPVVLWLVRHGWKRGAAASAALFGSIVVAGGVLALFGNLFVQQLVQLIEAAPQTYANVAEWVEGQFDVAVPESGDLVDQALSSWGGDVASGALLLGSSIAGGVIAFLTVMLVTYYLLAAGPKFRATICRYLTPSRQQEVLRLWEVTQTKVSDFLSTRVVLAAIATVATAVFLLILGTPYALPLALFTGLVSQFIPTIGTYLGGALPIVVALTSQDLTRAVVVAAFIVAYQQVENLWLAPKVSEKALEMNPAVSFVVVLGFGAVFGPLGAFLGLPIAATIQAVAGTYLRRHELVSSPMLADPEAAPART